MNIRPFVTLKWVFFVSRRFSSGVSRSRNGATSFLASLGIGFGVMALIVIVSVMNGFQLSYIDSILEISSYHIRASFTGEEDEARFTQYAESLSDIKVAVPFFEGQSLIATVNGNQSGALIRAVPPPITQTDGGFCKEAVLEDGSFDLRQKDSIVLGSSLARSLNVRVGDCVSLVAMSGAADVDLLREDRVFYVTGVFTCGYADINSSYAFVSIDAKTELFGANARAVYGIKLTDSNRDARVIARLQKAFPDAQFESWRSYNRSFFGALRVEKNMLMMLVFLIFVVVGINIYNGMRRMVYEKREEMCVLAALGGKKSAIQAVFLLQGLVTGFTGALGGVLGGLAVSVNVDALFMALSDVSYAFRYCAALIFSPATAGFIKQNMMYAVYAQIPARIVLGEVVAISLFGVLSSLVASIAASMRILRLPIAEVLRDE